MSGWTLSGNYLPKGTFIAASPLLDASDPESFPDPEKFLLKRWLFKSIRRFKISRGAMDETFHSFGKREHVCVGVEFLTTKEMAVSTRRLSQVDKMELEFQDMKLCKQFIRYFRTITFSFMICSRAVAGAENIPLVEFAILLGA